MFKELLSGGLMLLGALVPGNPEVDSARLPPTGLTFADPAQLRGVPLAELPYAGYQLPLRVDLSEHMPRPGFQGRQNSCVAWVSAYAVKTYQEKLEQRYTLTQAGQMDLHKVFSPAFVYNQINQGRDGGATLIDALNLLSGRGAVPWADMPYNIDDFTRQPSSDQLKEARRYRIAYWRQVNISDQRELKAHLLAGYPIMIGALVDESLYRLRPGTVWQHSAGKSLGGHALVLVGYDEGRHAFKLMNSWGPDWADQGFGWVDYGQLASVMREGYVAKDALDDKPLDMVFNHPDRDGHPFSTQPPTPQAVPGTVTQETAGIEPDALDPVTEHKPAIQKDELDDAPDVAQIPSDKGPDGKEDQKKGYAEEQRHPERKTRSQSQRSSPPLQDSLSRFNKQLDANNRDSRYRLPSYEQSQEVYLQPVALLNQRVEGTFLVLEGPASLPDDQGGIQAQVLVRFYTDAAATKSVKATNQAYALPDGSAVAISPPQPANQSHLNWQARIPLVQLPYSPHGLWLKPVLYLDHFGIATGSLVKLK